MVNSFKYRIKAITPEFFKRPYRKYKKASEEKLYRGDKVFCPICESKYEIFAPFYLNQKKSRCINCGSLERHRLLWLYLNEKTNIFKSKKIKLLHFAPEKTFYDIFSVNHNIDYYPCDLFPEHYKYRGVTKVIKADITDLQFYTNYFDIILCNHVLEHIPNDIKAMAELKRVLKINGWGIFQVPIKYKLEKTYEDFSITTPEGREKAFGQHDHVRWYGKDYKDRLASVGFNVHEDDYVRKFSSDDIFKYCLTPNELIYYCEG